jgi:hypothetical protein
MNECMEVDRGGELRRVRDAKIRLGQEDLFIPVNAVQVCSPDIA